jgi:hypothetical protein
MAYTEGLIEVRLARRADLNSVADVTGGTWGPAFYPMYVVGVAALIDNTIAAAGVVKFDKRPTFGSDSGRGDGDVGVLNLATSHVGGKVVYKRVTPIKISPGEEVVAEVTDATGASDTADLILFLSPSPEEPGNLSAMVAST